MEERIRDAVGKALLAMGAADTSFAVETPTENAHGDYAVNAALTVAKKLGKNPRDIANDLVEVLKDALGEDAARVEVAGPGFVNIAFSQKALSRELSRALSEGEEWGKGKANEGARVMVEFTDPNPFKEMHIGHAMNNTIGEALSRLFEWSGATVARANYEGDVGPHVAKALWALMKSGTTEPGNAAELGESYARGSRAYEESESAKAEIDALNRRIYAGNDHELMELWRKGREVSLASFEEIYRVLGTKFSYYFFESETAPIGLGIVKDALQKGVFEESDGAVIYRGEKKGKHTRVFVTSQGTPTYETKEIGLAFLKEERWPSDRSVIVTANEQTGHFSVVLEALKEVAPLLGEKTMHVPHGFLKLTSGKMSSREGNVVTAAALINGMIELVSKKNPDPLIAEKVAVAAIKYPILRQSAGGDITFDPDASLSYEGDSGPYLQYAFVRARSVLAQAKIGASAAAEAPPEPYALARLIVRFPDVVSRAVREFAPHHVTQYLTQLAGEWNSFYAKERIIGGEYESYKLALAQAFANTMRNGLTLLGIPTPEKM